MATFDGPKSYIQPDHTTYSVDVYDATIADIVDYLIESDIDPSTVSLEAYCDCISGDWEGPDRSVQLWWTVKNERTN